MKKTTTYATGWGYCSTGGHYVYIADKQIPIYCCGKKVRIKPNGKPSTGWPKRRATE